MGSYKYAPYGATTVANHSGTTQAGANRFRYIGGYQDKTTTGADGYYKLGARYYDARGHFTQPDPIIPGGGDYGYSSGDPVNRSDPSGYLDIPTPEDFIKAGKKLLGKVSPWAAVGCSVYTATTYDYSTDSPIGDLVAPYKNGLMALNACFNPLSWVPNPFN